MAVRITLKRSSIPNKRPTADMLDPGELALNTNALTPGLFFETDNNQVVKVGPTSVGPTSPTLHPSLGESWLNSVTKELSIGANSSENADIVWEKIAAPYLGGTNGYVVFVAPEFPSANDEIGNNGQASPYKTLNRAAIEIAKQSIAQNNESDYSKNNRYVIIVSPSIVATYNGPGLPLVAAEGSEEEIFSAVFEGPETTSPTPLVLQQFNPTTGGVIIPRGTSILGMDLRKVEIRPSYVPTYKNPTTGEGVFQPRSGILKWTGNSVFSEFSVRDKRTQIAVREFRTGRAGEGEFISSRPHCFGFNDRVFFEWVPQADQRSVSGQSAAITSGYFYTYPTGVDSFYLSYTDLTRAPNYVERSQLPSGNQNLGFYAYCHWEGRSHNRLSAITSATKEELDTFYQKVQKAFPETFHGRTNQAEVANPGETQIVAPVPLSEEESLLSNSTDNSSPYAHNITVRSNYGMCGLDVNGDEITGFKSALAGSVTVCSLQNDPVAYEVYSTIQDPITLESLTGWYTLQYATWAAIPSPQRPPNPSLVTRTAQMAYLNNTDVVNVRYHYRTLTNEEGFSYGYPNLETDFRHFAFRCLNGGFAQVDSGWTIGTAIGYWSLYGGNLTVTNSATNFGLNALRSEGFTGMGSDVSTSSSFPNDSDFSFRGIRLPEKITSEDTTNSTVLELGPNITEVKKVGEVQEITIGQGFLPINLLPYSLAPGTGVYSRIGGVEYRAFFVDDELPTTIILETGQTILRVRSADSTFPEGSLSTNPFIRNWSPPFIKRWKDPRNIADASYSLILTNTNPSHRPPELGSILRLNQNNSSATKLLRPGVQFDPGPSGGWGKVFKIAYSESSYRGDSPQLNEVLINRNTGDDYYVSFLLVDGGRPWVPENDHAHGVYTTYDQRNWYAAANDQWNRVYFSSDDRPIDEIKLPPSSFNSPWAISQSSEILVPVKETYQGSYGPDPELSLYEEGYYFRGADPAVVNFGFELAVNIDNGTNNFGLLRHNVMTSVTFATDDVIEPLQTEIVLDTVEGLPSPNRYFVVLAITNSLEPTRKEYVQVISIDENTSTVKVVRGLYNTSQDKDWPADSTLTFQAQSTEVLAQDYDFDWSISKQTILRFFEVMGYTKEALAPILVPKERSFRNVYLDSLTIKPKDGFALSTGPWPLSFSTASQLDVLSHSFHSVGRISYSRGLPRYLDNEFATKQYYDFLSNTMWGGFLTVTGADENGNLPTSGEFTQAGTGRPYGTYTSEVSDFSRINPGDQTGGGGGDGEAGVTAVYTGEGLGGGPIFKEGTLFLRPPLADEIGGVKAGDNITITAEGVISSTGGSAANILIDPILGLPDASTVQEALEQLEEQVTDRVQFATVTGEGVTADIVPSNAPAKGTTLKLDVARADLNTVGVTQLTDDPDGISETLALTQKAGGVLLDMIQALTGANVCAGTYDAQNGVMVYVTPAAYNNGFRVGQNLPAPSRAIDNYYAIITIGGDVGPNGPERSQAGDWYICQAEEGVTPVWFLVDYENITVAAENVFVQPISGIEFTSDAQGALTALERQTQDRLEFVKTTTEGLNLSLTDPDVNSYDGTTLTLDVDTASLTGQGLVQLTSELEGNSEDLALTQYAGNVLLNSIAALKGASVLAGTFDASTGLMVAVTPIAIERGFTQGQRPPSPSLAIDNFYVIITTGGNQAPPGVIGPTISQAGDWYVCEAEKGVSAVWLLIDYENRPVSASNVAFSPIPGISSTNVQDALEEVEGQAQASISQIISGADGIDVSTTAAGPNGRTTTITLQPANQTDIGGIFCVSSDPNNGLTLSADGGLSLNKATANKLGGVKQGQGVTIAPDGTLSVNTQSVRLLDSLDNQFNGSKTQFSLTSGGSPVAPFASFAVLVVLGGIVQTAPDAYTVAGSTITFSSPPPAGASFYGLVFG